MSERTRDLIDLRDAVASLIADAAGDPERYTVRPGFLAASTLQDLSAGVSVWVIPVTVEDEPEYSTRGQTAESITLGVQLAARVDPADTESLGRLIRIEMELRDLLLGAGRIGGAHVLRVELGGGGGELYDLDTLLSHRTFAAALAVTLL